MPLVRATAAPGGLLLGEEDAAFRRTCGSGFHGVVVGRTGREEVVDVAGEQSPFEQRSEHVGKQQIGHGLHAVAGCGVASDGNAQLAQVLDQAPDFGTADADLRGNLRPADYDGCVIGEETDDLTEAQIGLGRSLMR